MTAPSSTGGSSLRLISALALAALALSCGCRRKPPPAPAPLDQGAVDTVAPIVVRWDPTTGKGDVVHNLLGGDRLRTCFHCGYAGYTGGLVIGSFEGSGMGFYPRAPIRGFSSINLFCAQDESIWDRDERREYAYGWSENFGKGDDGERLAFVRGRIVDRGPPRVILQSENAGGCYRVTKLAYTRIHVAWWILATRVANRCDHPVHLDLWTGDDPWLGRYRSAEGDVGWTPEGLVEKEASIAAFAAGGLYDLGNPALGQDAAGFSAQANFFLLDPATPLPDRAYLANRFAHEDRDIDTGRALDAKSMIALNLGWTDRTLAPGEGMTLAMAVGRAETGEPGTLPRAPAIDVADWSVWRRFLREGNGAGERVEFAAEEVDLDIDPGRREVRIVGRYFVRNQGESAATLLVHYPILVGKDSPAPRVVEVDGRTLAVSPPAPGAAQASVDFPLTVGPRALARFTVRYAQPMPARHAAYMVTSARRWPGPVGRAVFHLRHPASLGQIRATYPIKARRTDGAHVIHTIALRDFVPDRELEVTW